MTFAGGAPSWSGMDRPPPDPIRAHLRSLIDRLGSGARFADDDDVVAAGVVRSINLLELIVAVEDDYRITVDERDVFAGRLRSVDSLVALVRERTGGQA